MEIYLFSRPETEHDPGQLRGLTRLLDRYLPGYRTNREFARKMEEMGIPAGEPYDRIEDPGALAISYGGDGTFLDCVRLVGENGTPILGINSGRLGFLANVPLDDIERAFADIASGKYATEERALLRIGGDVPAGAQQPLAFNEFSLQRGGGAMIAVETYVDSEMVATYWGDGAMVSTASGSTAYSLSVGGPVLAPGCDCFVISPIAPHNLTMRPVVVPNRCEITMKVRARHCKPYATADNRSFETCDGAVFSINKAKKSAILVKLQNISFYDTLRNKMLWGVDKRDER